MAENSASIIEFLKGGWYLREKTGGGYELTWIDALHRDAHTASITALLKRDIIRYEEPHNPKNRYLVLN